MTFEEMTNEGMISMCSANQCIYNREDMCHAEAVQVAVHEDHADCETFSPQ